MPGTNAGTGYPLTLRCVKCNRARTSFDVHSSAGTNLEATGRTRKLARSQEGRGNPRAIMYRAEYRCLDCGHTGWTRHVSIERIAAAKGITLTAPED